jgi:tetratricopeptide (TPR) repeat protein
MTILKITRKGVPIVVLALMAFAVASPQTQGKGKIRGVVLNEATGEPLEGVTVRMYSIAADASLLPAPRTNKEGQWKALYIRAGIWTLEFEKTGFIPQKLTYRISTEIGERIPFIEAHLREVKGLLITESLVAQIDKATRLFDQQKFAEARQAYEELLEKNPDLFVLRGAIGNCYFATGEYDKAIASYQLALQKQPDSVDFITKIANAYNNWGKTEEALEWYRKIPSDQIQDIVTAYNTGVLFHSIGKAEEALPYLRRSLEIEPGFADGYYRLGLACAALNRTSEAVQAMKKFMELAPDSPDFENAKALVKALSR